MKTIITLVLTAMIGASSAANACTVMPIDESSAKNELAMAALNKIDVDITRLQGAEITNYQGEYIWTPMCPKGENTSADMVLRIAGRDSICEYTLSVEKHDIYENRSRNKFKITTHSVTCGE